MTDVSALGWLNVICQSPSRPPRDLLASYLLILDPPAREAKRLGAEALTAEAYASKAQVESTL